MRVDLFLKRAGLVKQRSLAKDICDRGEVAVDGRKAKAGKEISVGSSVTVELPSEYLEIEIVALPDRNYKRKQGETFYKVMKYEKKDPYWG